MVPELKRLKAMYVYEILSEKGEELSRADINKILWDKYKIKETPKTLKKLLDDMVYAELIEIGEQKDRTTRKRDETGEWIEEDTTMTLGYFVEKDFSDDELLWIIHNTIFSKQLTENKSNNLVKKLLKLGTNGLKQKVGSVEGMKQFYHTPNPAVSNNIETLSDAIHEDKTVQFIYTEYKKDKQLHPLSKEPIIVKPARMVPLNGFYYLIAYELESETIQHYRIDKIKNLELADIKTDFSSKNSRINIDEYLSSHSFMFAGKPIPVKIKVPEDKIGLVIDRFGDKIHIYQDDSDYVSIGFNSNESDLYVWALENGEYVEVIEPQHIRNKIRETAKTMHLTYSKEDLDKYYLALERAKKPIMHIYRFGCPDFDLSTRNEWKCLTNLNELYIENNNISDLSVICELTNLRKVQIVNEKISDISSLLKLERLRSLCLSDTLVEDISILEQINPRWLKLTGNYNIKDYSVLSRLSSLKVLWLDEETFEKIDIKAIKDNNPQIQITYEHETDGMIRI